MNPNADRLLGMAKGIDQPLHNYAGIPGLTSWLLHDGGLDGRTRLVHMTRNQRGDIAPHSHRYPFQCQVLEGFVEQRVWRQLDASNERSNRDKFAAVEMVYEGHGVYRRDTPTPEYGWWAPDLKTYTAGEWYGMDAEEIHSIEFSKGAVVLFIEGPAESSRSTVLLPVVNDNVLDLVVPSWAFSK